MGLLFVPVLTFSALLLSLFSYLGASQAQNIDGFLTPHNAARAAVGVANLTWSPAVASFAQNYTALQRSKNACTSMIHSGGHYGENLFWGSSGKAWIPKEAVDLWVSAKQNYDHNTNACAAGKQCGQYTQVVWRATTGLGCASVVCNDTSTLIMCSYDPAGNIIGQKPY